MKYCIVTPTFPGVPGLSRGGQMTYIETLTRALLAQGVEVHVVLYAERPWPAPLRVPLPVTLHTVTLPWLRYVSSLLPVVAQAWTLNRFLRQLDAREHFDAIEGVNEEGLFYFVAGTFGRRFWLRMHTSLRQHVLAKKESLTWIRRFGMWFDGVTARRCRNLITHSTVHAAAMAREYRLPVERIHVLPHALAEPSPPQRRQPGPVVAYIGALDQRKGVDVLLEAAPAICAAVPAAKVLVVGRDGGDSPDGTWEKWFANRHPALAASGAVRFCGPLEDAGLEPIWETAGVVTVPSRYESFGLVVLEAFARGLPVVAADGGALPEVVKDGGLVVPAGNPTALAEALARVLSDETLAAELGRRGRAVYEAHYTLEKFGAALVALVTRS